MSKASVRGLRSTVILGFCLIIAILLANFLSTINLSEGWQDYGQSLQENPGDIENMGEMGLVLVLVAAMGALMIAIISYAIAIMTFAASSLPLIFSIRNYTVENKAIKIINIVYSIFFSAISLFAQIKIITFALGIG